MEDDPRDVNAENGDSNALTLTLMRYQQMGGARAIVASYVPIAISKMAEDDIALARTILKVLSGLPRIGAYYF